MERNGPGNRDERRLSREEFERVVVRAIEIDSARGELSEKDMLEIGKEIGIHPDSLRAALAERDTGRDLPRVFPFSGLRAIAGAAVASTLVGLAARALRPLFDSRIHWESLGGLVLIVLGVTILAFFPARRRSQRTFQLLNLTVWAGFAVGWSVVHGAFWSDLIAVSAMWCIGSAIVGSVITHLRSSQSPDDLNLGGSDAVPSISLLTRLSRVVRSRLHSWLIPSRRVSPKFSELNSL